MLHTRAYRADVDGLRGLAILAVLLFHYRLPGVGGGFVGVDVFFVISGFLITRNIVQDIDAGTWSYARFYTRRARRLFPALFLTLTASFAAASVLLMPNEFEWFASTALNSVVSTSNVLYWLELGYFGPDAERTPLLHTWSLSVEEQFYLVWPALMLLFLGGSMARRGGGVRTRLLIAAMLLAGVLSVWGGQWLLDRDPNAAFYLMPFRIAEFAAGAVLVWLPRLAGRGRRLEESLLALGLVLVLYAVIRFDKGMQFPGIAALVPALGTALVIYAGRARWTGLLLRNTPMVWVGLLSYSLYLVHWPLLVFFEIALMRPLGGAERGALGAAAVLLAWLMMRYVERPFREAPRRPRHLSPAAFGLSCAGATIVMLWTCSAVLAGDGWTWRIPAEIRAPLAGLDQLRNERAAMLRTGTCHMNMWQSRTADGNYVDERCLALDPKHPNYLVLGDSHAADRYAGLAALYTDVNFLQMTTASCRPLLDTDFRDYHCAERVRYAMREFLPRVRTGAAIDGVILAGRWQESDLDPLRRTLDYLRGLGVRVIVLGPAVEFDPWVADLVFVHGRRDGLDDWVSRFRVAERDFMDARVRALAEAARVHYYSSIEAYCSGGRCPVLSDDNRFLIVDYGHQSPEGALVQARGYKALGLEFPHARLLAGRASPR